MCGGDGMAGRPVPVLTANQRSLRCGCAAPRCTPLCHCSTSPIPFHSERHHAIGHTSDRGGGNHRSNKHHVDARTRQWTRSAEAKPSTARRSTAITPIPRPPPPCAAHWCCCHYRASPFSMHSAINGDAWVLPPLRVWMLADGRVCVCVTSAVAAALLSLVPLPCGLSTLVPLLRQLARLRWAGTRGTNLAATSMRR